MTILLKNVILGKKKKDIFIKQGLIEKIGDNLNLKAQEKIDAKGCKAVMPSLVNTHTHSAMVLLRGYADDLPLKEWLEKKIWPLEDSFTQDDIYWGVKLACLEMIKTGTTLFNDMYMFPETTMKAVNEMGIRAFIGLVMINSKDIKYLEKEYSKLERKQNNLVKVSVSPHALYTVSRENLIQAGRFASKKKLFLHTHLSETKEEVRHCLKKYKKRPAEFLDQVGLLSSRTILAHSVHLTDQEIKLLAQRKCSVSYNPTSNLKLSVGGVFPYKKMKQFKVNITLGTDGCASNNNLDLIEEMKIAGLIQKHQEKDPTVSPAKEILEIASENGFKFFNLNGGKIEKGKIGDLILLDLNQPCLIPGHNIVSDFVYSASGSVVTDLICNGKILMRNRKVQGEKEIINQARKRALEYGN
jgi:5-methylthioadenosine/S-adenosylhomocysteine deaminase